MKRFIFVNIILLCLITSCTSLSPTLTTQPSFVVTQDKPNQPTTQLPTTQSAKPQTSKGEYKDLGVPPAFKKLYDDAKAKNESWVTKAEEVASQAAGKGADKILIYNSAPDKAVAIVFSGNLEDDSVKQIEKWIELTKKGSVWEVDWIGERFMCRRGSNTTQWQKEFCP